MNFNVPMLGLAAGLLAPTRGGSFGGALANGLNMYSGLLGEQAQRDAIKQRMGLLAEQAEIGRQDREAQLRAAEAAQREAERLQAARQGYGRPGPMAANIQSQDRQDPLAGVIADAEARHAPQGLAPMGLEPRPDLMGYGGAPKQPSNGGLAPMGLEPRPDLMAQSPVSMYQSMLMQYQDALRNGDFKYAETLEKAMQQIAPQSLSEGAAIVDPLTGAQTVKNAKTATPLDPLTAQVKQAQLAGDPFGPNAEAVQRYEMSKAAAGATRVNTPINVEADKSIMRQVGPILKEERDRVSGAVNLANSAGRMLSALDGGTVLAGPTASWRLKGAQIGQMLGFGGEDTEQTILRTRRVVRELSQAAVEARKLLAGQGQVTENEAKAVEKAVSGDIDDLTVPEIRAIAELNIKHAHFLRNNFKPMLDQVGERERQFFKVPGLDSIPEIPKPLGDVEETEFDRALRKYGG